MQRRDFLKLSATAGAVSCVTACGGKSGESVTPPPPLAPENIDYSTCTCNCFLNCVLKIHSRDGVITRVESEGQVEGQDSLELRQARACYRGRSAKQRVNHPDRLKYPMKRVGPRGSGQFERISWDEAFELIATNLKQIKEQYGNESIHPIHGSGTLMDGAQAGDEWVKRLLGLNGGYLRWHGAYSSSQINRAMELTFGGSWSSTSDNLQHSDLLLSFGWNPNEMHLGGSGNGYEWLRNCSKLKDAYFMEPRYTDSMVGKESKWVPVRPGTDAALVEAIAYLLITRNQTDEAFLAKYCIGYDKSTLPASAKGKGDYKSYILGTEDGTPKTPARAAEICGVPEHLITEIADKLAAAERPFITQGWGLQRQANGEQSCRAVMMLPLLVGKLGIPGTSTGFMPTHQWGNNMILEPVPLLFIHMLDTIDIEGHNEVKASIQCANWAKAAEMDDGSFTMKDFDLVTYTDHGLPEMDPSKLVTHLPHGIKFIWCYATNGLINQHQDPIHTAKVLKDESKVQFIVCHDVRHTSSTLYADVILPGTMDTEQDDMMFSAGTNVRTAIAASTSIKPAFEAKNSYEVGLGVAEKLGLGTEYSEGRTQEEWFRYIWKDAQRKDPRLPDYDEMRKKKILKLEQENTLVALDSYVKDPVANRLYTPSGKIEIYSETLANWGSSKTIKEHETVTPVPTYVKTQEGYEDEELKQRFPLQFINVHGKPRVHSNFELPWTREVVEDPLWMNPVDAEARGLQSGQKVAVESLRGKLHKTLRVTPRIVPGVVAMAQGAPHKMKDGVDVGGCANTLINRELSPVAKNIMSNTNLVEVSAAPSSNA